MAFTYSRILTCGIFCVFIFRYVALVAAQTPAQGQTQSNTQLSPQAAYEEAIRPLEITRRSPQNWSEIELAALKVARDNATIACLKRNPDETNGEELLALDRLCAFAQQWQPVYRAASIYIAAAQSSSHGENPKGSVGLATAFDYRVQASLNLKNLDDAIFACQTMLRTVRYNVFVSEATNTTLDAIRLTRMDQALELLAQRQPILLSVIRAHGSHSATVPDTVDARIAESPLSLRALYTDAIALPFLQSFANKPKEADDSYAQLESALPDNIAPEDATYITERRRQYRLLGKPLPTLNATGSLLQPGAPPPDNLNSWFANATVFLLFPDWCNQCITMGFNSLTRSRELITAHEVRLIPLIAQANPPQKRAEAPIKNVPLSAKAAKAALANSQQLHVDQQLAIKSSPDSLLEGTPSVVVSNETLESFAAADFPLIVATDHGGIVRWIERAPDDALDEDGEIDHIVQHILAAWPPD